MTINSKVSLDMQAPPASEGVPRRLSGSRHRLLKKLSGNAMVVLGGSVVFLLVLVALFGPLIVPHGPMSIDTSSRLEGPSAQHWMGTDNYGRDLAARVVVGARVSLTVGATTAFFASLLGTAFGLLAAYNRVADAILMRIADGLMAFPAILLAIAIMVAMGPRLSNIILALSVVFAPYVARVVRSSALVIREQTFVEALRAQQANWMRILWLNIAPNVLSPLIVQATFIFADAIIVEAALSFLGAGVPPPQPSWGNTLLDGKSFIFNAWWLTVFPGIAIMTLVTGINLLGDGLRDVFDPKFRGRA